MTQIAGKTVLITGAASGIGKLMAQQLGQMGATLVLWDYNRESLESTTTELKRLEIQAHAFTVDLSDKTAVNQAALNTLEAVLSVDIVINNAGIVAGKTILEATDEEIERTFDVNALALFWVVRAFLPGMIERNAGHIVTVASAAGISGTAKLVDYCASKFAAVGFDEALRIELHRLNTQIKTTVVCPYYIDTGMFDGVKTRFPRLLPILKPDYVVKKVIHAIQHNKARVIMPRMIQMIYPARLLPTPLFDAIQRFFGINTTMDTFAGRARQPKPTGDKVNETKNPHPNTKPNAKQPEQCVSD
jgi:all-trans-retinol dehydrogenase (NAD+)